MAYRKEWYTYGIRSSADIVAFTEANIASLAEGDSVYNTTYQKPEYWSIRFQGIRGAAFGVWLNEDQVPLIKPPLSVQNFEEGNLVSLVYSSTGLVSGGSYNNATIQLATGGSAVSVGQYCGVVTRPNYADNILVTVAIQGIYNVKFTVLTNGVTAGNLAILSTTPGEASQAGSGASTGVIGVIMETKDFNETARLAKVMIQSFSSR